MDKKVKRVKLIRPNAQPESDKVETFVQMNQERWFNVLEVLEGDEVYVIEVSPDTLGGEGGHLELPKVYVAEVEYEGN